MNHAPRALLTDNEWQKGFFSEFFHSLAQPLTALQCLLELSLRQNPDLARQRAALCQANELTTKIVDKTKFMRRIADACNPGHCSNVSVLKVIHSVADELFEVAESRNCHLRLSGKEQGPVLMDPTKLREALFYTLDHALDSVTNADVLVQVSAERDSVSVAILPSEFPSPERLSTITNLPRNLVVAKHIITAVGGHMTVRRSEHGLYFRILLPLASVQDQVARL